MSGGLLDPASSGQHAPRQASKSSPWSTTVASGLAELLLPWIGCAFTVPGAGNLPFICAWSGRGRQWIPALEEKRGLAMAEGYVRTGGRLAMMSTTAGPGTTNLASGLYLALREQTPVFVVAGQTPRAYATRLPVQELDTKSFARSLTLAARELTAPEQLEGFVRELVRVALHPCRRGPVLLAVPADLWQAPCSLHGRADLAVPWSVETCAACANALRAARRPLIVAGSGVTRSDLSDALFELVGLLPRARVATTPRAQGGFPASHAQYVGAIGFGGTVGTELSAADLVLVLGSRLHEMTTNFDDRFLGCRLIHLDIDPLVPGHAVPAEGYCVDLVVALKDLVGALGGPRRSRTA